MLPSHQSSPEREFILRGYDLRAQDHRRRRDRRLLRLVMGIGFWASTKVHNDEDFFLGGRRFGKGLLVMHWLCTGTHSEQACKFRAPARVWAGRHLVPVDVLFSTPFYWLIAPMIRRLRS